jgi:hypothetical protein
MQSLNEEPPSQWPKVHNLSNICVDLCIARSNISNFWYNFLALWMANDIKMSQKALLILNIG